MERLTNRTKEAKSNVTIKEVCDKLADYEDLEELIGIPLKELAKIFRQYITDNCKHPQKAIVLTDGDAEKWEARQPIDDNAFRKCPCCYAEFNSELVNEYNIEYCPYCGQKLDWSGEE